MIDAVSIAGSTTMADCLQRSAGESLVDTIRRRQTIPRPVENPTFFASSSRSESEQHERDYSIREALSRMHRAHPRQAAVVTMRHMEDYSTTECAVRLCLSERTVKRDARNAYAWLRRELTA